MKVVLIPNPTDLKVIVDPGSYVPEKTGFIIPGMWAPWPEAQEKGFVEIDVAGDTLRALLVEITKQYKQAGVDYDPICPNKGDIKFDFDVLVNGKQYAVQSHGLDASLKTGDVVEVNEATIGFC